MEPLILTIMLEPSAQAYFTQLRTTHFPKHCNYLEAHLTLFHKLPQGKDLITRTLEALTQRSPLSMEIDAVKSIGNGVAFQVKCSELKKRHEILQKAFSPYLISQDRQRLWPHITVQNKVTAFKASQTLALLQKDFKPFKVAGIGIAAWLYQGGPWEKHSEYLFTGA